MKKYISVALLVLIILIAAPITIFHFKKNKPVVEQPEDDFLKIPEYTTESTSSTYNDGNSYWWILVEDMGGDIRRNDFVKQEHSYFSYSEAKEYFKKESGKDCFILNFVKVDKETYEHNQE
jgi:hypothetical protein